jgi:hypothetical protein
MLVVRTIVDQYNPKLATVSGDVYLASKISKKNLLAKFITFNRRDINFSILFIALQYQLK